MSSVNKITTERNQRALLELAAKSGNDVCADCKNPNPRWASHNLGIFLCMSCASIHRKIGTHVSKVKSLTLDSWNKEQVETMRQKGNINSNAFFNPNESRHPPPATMMDTSRDGEMEMYIRAKYESKKFIDKSAIVASKLGPSKLGPSATARLSPMPTTSPTTSRPRSTSPIPPPIAGTGSVSSRTLLSSPPAPPRQHQSRAPPERPHSLNPSKLPQATQVPSQGGVWDDLASLQAPSQSASLPLQYAAPASIPLPPRQDNHMHGSYGMLSASPGDISAFQASTSLPGPFLNTGMNVATMEGQGPHPPRISSSYNSGSPLTVNNPIISHSMPAPFQQYSQPQLQASLQLQMPMQLMVPQPQSVQQQPQRPSFLGAPSHLGQPPALVQMPQSTSPYLQQQPSPSITVSQPSTPFLPPPVMPVFLQQTQSQVGHQNAQIVVPQASNTGSWMPGQPTTFYQQSWNPT